MNNTLSIISIFHGFYEVLYFINAELDIFHSLTCQKQNTEPIEIIF